LNLINFKVINKGKVKAVFDIETPKLTICDCRLMVGNDGQLWAATPTQEFINKAGEKKYRRLIILSEDLQKRITDLARETLSQK